MAWVGGDPLRLYTARIVATGPAGFVTVTVTDDPDVDGNPAETMAARGAGTVGAYVTVAVAPNGTARII